MVKHLYFFLSCSLLSTLLCIPLPTLLLYLLFTLLSTICGFTHFLGFSEILKGFHKLQKMCITRCNLTTRLHTLQVLPCRGRPRMKQVNKPAQPSGSKKTPSLSPLGEMEGKTGKLEIIKTYKYTAHRLVIGNGGAMISVGRVIPKEWQLLLVDATILGKKGKPRKVILEIEPIGE